MRIGILPGTFNPPTNAHVGLAEAALPHVDRVIFVLPRVLPHKDYGGVPFEERLTLLKSVAEPRFSVAVTSGGLFLEIARELAAPGDEVVFLCGRDAAERIVGWDYGDGSTLANMFREFSMLVACRNGEYEAPERLRERVRPLTLARACDHISATEVRQRIRNGQAWEHLVPEEIQEQVRSLYGAP